MISIDARRGSAEPKILKEFETYAGVPTQCVPLVSADFSFIGFGPPEPGGDPDYGSIASFGFERKTLPDFLQSLENGRLIAQAARMSGADGEPGVYTHPFIILEAVYRADSHGMLQIPLGGQRWGYPHGLRPFPVEKVDNALSILSVAAGIRVERTWGYRETVALVVRQWKLYQKLWGSHQTARGFATVNLANKAHFITPTQARAVAATFPSIGWERSGLLSETYPSVAALVDAAANRPDELTRIGGLGKATAKLVHRAVVEDNFTMRKK